MMNKTLYLLSLWLTCLVMLWGASWAQAQDFGGINNTEAIGTSYHVYARPGEPTMQILVLGTSGGIYQIGTQTSLTELLALLGGINLDSGGQTRRRVVIRVVRQEGGRSVPVYEASMDQLLLEPNRHPTLQDGDMLMVKAIERTRFSWRDALSIFTSATSIIVLVEQLRRR